VVVFAITCLVAVDAGGGGGSSVVVVVVVW
jgi:hypothetical protein